MTVDDAAEIHELRLTVCGVPSSSPFTLFDLGVFALNVSHGVFARGLVRSIRRG